MAGIEDGATIGRAPIDPSAIGVPELEFTRSPSPLHAPPAVEHVAGAVAQPLTDLRAAFPEVDGLPLNLLKKCEIFTLQVKQFIPLFIPMIKANRRLEPGLFQKEIDALREREAKAITDVGNEGVKLGKEISDAIAKIRKNDIDPIRGQKWLMLVVVIILVISVAFVYMAVAKDLDLNYAAAAKDIRFIASALGGALLGKIIQSAIWYRIRKQVAPKEQEIEFLQRLDENVQGQIDKLHQEAKLDKEAQ